MGAFGAPGKLRCNSRCGSGERPYEHQGDEVLPFAHGGKTTSCACKSSIGLGCVGTAPSGTDCQNPPAGSTIHIKFSVNSNFGPLWWCFLPICLSSGAPGLCFWTMLVIRRQSLPHQAGD